MKTFLGLFITGDRGRPVEGGGGFLTFCFDAKKKKSNYTHRGFQEGWRKGMPLVFILGFSSGAQVVSMFLLKGFEKGQFKVYGLSS